MAGRGLRARELVTDALPIVAVNENAGNPHYEPTAGQTRPIHPGDFVLLDMWAKKDTPGAVYYDITWTGVLGQPSTPRHSTRSSIWWRDARKAGATERMIAGLCRRAADRRLGGGRGRARP